MSSIKSGASCETYLSLTAVRGDGRRGGTTHNSRYTYCSDVCACVESTQGLSTPLVALLVGVGVDVACSSTIPQGWTPFSMPQTLQGRTALLVIPAGCVLPSGRLTMAIPTANVAQGEMSRLNVDFWWAHTPVRSKRWTHQAIGFLCALSTRGPRDASTL